MTVDQKILDGVGASAAAYTDFSTQTSSLSGYSIVGTPYSDEYLGGPNLGLQMVVYASSDQSKIIVSFVGTNEGKDLVADLDMAWGQFNDPRNGTAINNAVADALAANPGATVTFAGDSAGGIIAQYAAYTYQNQVIANNQDVTVNLVTNNAPGATDVLAAQSGVSTSTVADTAANFGYVANTYEQNDLVHLMGSAYVGSTTAGAQTLAIVTPDVNDPLTAHSKDLSLSDLGQVNDGTPGYGLTADTPHNFGISDTAAALTSAALANDADVLPSLDGPSAYAYGVGQFLSVAGTLGSAGQADGVKEFLDAYLNATVNHIAAQPGGTSWLADADAGAQAFAVEKLESWAANSPLSLTEVGEAIKDAAEGGAYTAAIASDVGSALSSATEGAYEDVMAAAKEIFSVPDGISDPHGLFDDGKGQASPLVIDLSSGHTGITLTTFDAATTTTAFDIEGTGFATQTAWTSGDTGFLVRDLNSNGTIDSVDEMFGSPTVDGFAKLAALDSNDDLKIDSQDSAWSSLQIWNDANGDGITQSGELHSLASENISSIDLASVAPSTDTIDGNAISHTSTVTFTNGSTSEIADAWFTHDGTNSFYNGTYSLDDSTLFLPDLRGYGILPELAISMSQDSTLKGLVSDFASGFSLDSFADPSTLSSDIANILYRWAGVDGVATDSRGANVNAQDLEFLEHLFDDNFIQGSSNSANPQQDATSNIETAWHSILATFTADILVQTAAATIFDSVLTYNPLTGNIDGTAHLSESGISDLATHAPGTEPGAEAFWVEVANFIDHTEGISSLDTDEQTWLNTAVSSTTTIGWDDIVNLYDGTNPGTYVTGTGGNDTLSGGDGDDYIDSGAGNDIVYAGSGNDTIYTGNGTDTINGEAGNDTITAGNGNDVINSGDGNDLVWAGTGVNIIDGGAGNDVIHGGNGGDTISGGTGGNFLHGGSGNDTFVFAGGDDVIYSDGGTDKITLPSGTTSGDLSFSRISSDGSTSQFNDLLITVASGGSIEIDNHFLGSGYQVGTIVFSDSSTLDLTTLTGYTTVLTSGDDDYSPGLNTNQTVYGQDGSDIIVTGTGNDTLDGGNGNDVLEGGGGNDAYMASPGFDTVEENGAGGTDTIVIPTGYSIDDITFSRHIGISGPDEGLVITIRGLGEILVTNQFYSSSYAVENLYFTDGSTTVSLADQTIQTIGSTGNDYLDGLTSGVAGNWFDGRGGNDYFTGGIGDNTFVLEAGFGNDTISIPYHTGNTNVLSFEGVDPANVRMWTNVYGDVFLQDSTNASHTLEILAGTTGSGDSENAISSYLSQITFDDSTTWNLASGLTLTGDNSGDSIYGSANNDIITGGTGNDYLYGNGGDDTLVGGGGADNLTGGTGNDTYVIAHGFGNTTITDNASAGSNVIHLTGIDPADIRLWTDSYGTLHLQDTTNPSYSITATAGTTGSGQDESTIGTYFSEVSFDSAYSTTWSLTGGLHITGDNSGDNLYGTAYGDVITGGTAADAIYGNGGDDTIIGGGGADYLTGGAGNDTYVLASGFGNTSITDNANGSASNTIHFTGIDPADIRLWTDLYGSLHIQDTTNPSYSVTVSADTTGSGYHESTIGTYFSEITFDSGYGTTIDLTGGLPITGDNSGDNLYGTGYGDTITGGTASDAIYGNGGNDIIYGGGGADYLSGGTGADTFVFKAATALSASATIADFSTGDGDKIDIANVISGYDPLADAIGNFVELTTGGGSTQLKVDTDGSGTSYTQIATISGVTGLNLNDLITDGNLIVHHT